MERQLVEQAKPSEVSPKEAAGSSTSRVERKTTAETSKEKNPIKIFIIYKKNTIPRSETRNPDKNRRCYHKCIGQEILVTLVGLKS
jgi:hypothetical protein